MTKNTIEGVSTKILKTELTDLNFAKQYNTCDQFDFPE